jgi:hypothetical protein
MHVFTKQLSLAGLALTLAATCAYAQDLRRFDMATVPLAKINLKGGSFIARLLEKQTPYRSQLLLECQDCTSANDALVGLATETSNDAADFAADPDLYLRQLNAVCLAQAQSCAFRKTSHKGLKGYAYVAHYADGITVVEHIYFSNGLVFVINASSASEEIAKANVTTLIDVASPYVTGKSN